MNGHPVEPPQRLNPHVVVRQAREEDAKRIAEIFRKSAPWTPFGPNASTDQILQCYLKEKNHEAILSAEYKEEVVGGMDYNKNNNRIGIPGIFPRYRKKEIGYTIFFHLLIHMREKGFSKAMADTGIILSDAIKMSNQFNFTMARLQ